MRPTTADLLTTLLDIPVGRDQAVLGRMVRRETADLFRIRSYQRRERGVLGDWVWLDRDAEGAVRFFAVLLVADSKD